MNNKGTIIALAWPDTLVIKEGKWYDIPLKILGFLKNGYYKAGHAAMLLINHETKVVEYFDFGRYHTPKKMGRVRDKYTDPDVEIITKASIENDKIVNLEMLLKELSVKKSTHGEGRLIASEKLIKNFNKAFDKAKLIQEREAIPYGPFNINGTNCSRFVAKVSRSSDIGLLRKLLIKIPYTLSPTPFSNVKIINDYGYYYEVKNKIVTKKRNRLFLFKKEK